MIYYVEKFEKNEWVFFGEFEYKREIKKYINKENYRVTVY